MKASESAITRRGTVGKITRRWDRTRGDPAKVIAVDGLELKVERLEE
jgi:hypothetical protein